MGDADGMHGHLCIRGSFPAPPEVQASGDPGPG